MIARAPLLLVAILEAKGASPLRPTGVDGQFTMDHTKDRFIHFTTHDKAKSILKDKVLRRSGDDPDNSAFGVSTTYGTYHPGVQFTQLAPRSEASKRTDPQHSREAYEREKRADLKRAKLSKTLSAVVFSTRTEPHTGHPEETTWRKDVDLHNARVVPFKTARAMLKRTPHKLGDDHHVVYGGGDD